VGVIVFFVFDCVLLTVMPLVEIVGSRILVWMKWMSWGRFVHAALPLKILIGQMAWKFVAGSFGKLEGFVRDYSIVDLECQILETCIPITNVVVGDDDDDADYADDDDDEDDDSGDGDGDSCGIENANDLFMAQDEHHDASSLQYDEYESEHESEEVYDSSESEEDY